jgi:hypothetical protein
MVAFDIKAQNYDLLDVDISVYGMTSSNLAELE